MNKRKHNNLTLGSVLKGLFVVILITIVLVYVQFQARNFIQGPSISISTPYVPIQNEQRIILEGSVENIVKLTLNGREINTNENGDFSELVILENGYTIITIHAEDRFGRSEVVERKYVYVERNE